MKRRHQSRYLAPFLAPLWGLALLAATLNAQGSIIVALSNLPGTGNFALDGNSLSTDSWAAVGLQTGPDALDFQSLTGHFFSYTGGHTLTGGIYSDVSGSPGALLAAFTGQMVATGDQASYTLGTASPYTLSASTGYWFVLLDPPPPLLWLQDSANTAPTVAPGYALLGYQTTNDRGAIWNTTTDNLSVEIALGTAPEPGVLLLSLTGLGALLRVRRRPPAD